MYKLAIFDLDDTLAEIGKPILPENLSLLKELEKSGMQTAVASGKPIYYLCGLMRQVGLEHPALIGENGAVLQLGVDLPPRNFTIMKYSYNAKWSIELLKEKFAEKLPDMWYQPNQVGLTPFPTTDEEFEIIEQCIEENKDSIKDISVYRHIDSVDIVPSNISKYTGLEYLGKLLNIPPEETIAVGDGVNDYSMFEYAGLSIGINLQDETAVNVNVSNVNEAINHILNMQKRRKVVILC